MLVRSSDVIVVSSDDESIQDSFDGTQDPGSSIPRQISSPSQEPNRWWELLSQYDNEGRNHDNSGLLMSRGTKRSLPNQQAVETEASVESPEDGLVLNGERKSKYFNRLRRSVPLELDTDSVIVILSSDDEGGNAGPDADDSGEKSPVQGGSPALVEPLPPSESIRSPEQNGTQTTDPPRQIFPEGQVVQNGHNGHSELPQTQQDAELDSDDEIAVLSKEEAERIGKFKPTTFERPPPPPDPNHNYRELLANTSFNQPVPLLQPPPPQQLYSSDPLQAQQDRKAHEYFDTQNVDQLTAYDSTLDAQLSRFDKLRDDNLNNMRDARARMESLSLTQSDERSELIREINVSLSDANTAILRAKKIRRYKNILHHVIRYKRLIFPNTYQIPLQSSFFGYSVPPGGSLPNPYNPQAPYAPSPRPTQQPMGYGQQTQNVYDDSVHLQELLKDVGNEEKIEGMALTPSELSVQLLDHQRRGLHWLLNREKQEQGSILADDMGLGKTVQTIALLMANQPEDSNQKTTLIVGPVSLLRQWNAELRAKINMEHKQKVAFYHGAEKKKINTFKKMQRFDVVLVSYTTLASEFKLHYSVAMEQAMASHGQNVLPSFSLGGQSYVSPFYSPDSKFYRVVLDEAQYIKNKVSQTSKATALLRSKQRLCLTGTPMQNSIDELYPILRFLRTRPYNDEVKFKRDISVPIRANDDRVDDYERNISMKKLRAILLAIMLRRTKDSKVDGKPLMVLPKKTIKKVVISMDGEESKAYKDLEAGIQKKAEKLLNSKHKNSHSNILTLLLRLRQACIHEILVEVGEMNSTERNQGVGGVQNWKTMYALAQNLPQNVQRRISEELRKDGQDLTGDADYVDKSNVQLTCPMCFDVVDQSSIVILHPCGHMICDGCVDGFFDSDRNDDDTVPCVMCRQKVSENSLISYSIYNQVVNESLNFDDLKAQYGLGSARKTTTGEKINKIIHDRGGFTLSAKLQKTLDIIRDVVKNSSDEKIIVFSHFTGTFDLMSKALQDSKIKQLRYDGTMNIDMKNTVIRRFYQGDERVLLISLKAGNVGLTLTCASHVIIMDPFWNPFVEDQAMDRAHRFGQQKPVTVYKMLVTDSVEDRIINLQDRKKELVNSALDSTELKKSSALGRQELGYLFGLNNMGPRI